MTKTEVSVVINRPVGDVWKFIADWSNHWDPGILGMKQTSVGPTGVGTTLQVMRASYPKMMDGRIDEYEPNQRITFEVTSGPIRGTKFAYTLETSEGKTRLTETTFTNFSGFFKLFEPILGRKAKISREGETRINTAKRMLESEGLS